MSQLHIITDDEILRRPDFLARAEAVLHAVGPRGALHLRGHGTSARVLYDFGKILAPLASLAGARLVINDRVDVALAVGIRAVQVGERSFRVDDVRRIAPGILVGESVHSVRPTSADWLMAGHIFDTPSHAGEPSRGLAFLEQICRVSSVPVIAVGGIMPADVRAVRAAGASGVAVIRGIWEMGAVHDYLGEFDR